MSYLPDPTASSSGHPVPPDPRASQSTQLSAARERAWRFDLISGLLLTGFCGLFYVSQPALMLASFTLTLPWIIRRRYPRTALAVATVGALGVLVASPMPAVAIITVPLLIYTYARWFDRTLARLALGIGLIGSILGPLRWLVTDSSLREVLVHVGVLMMTVLACAGMVCLAYVLGSRRRERSERAAQSIEARIERERLLAAEQEQRARVASINERNRIARELHDIVAHSLSVIVVQAEGGRALAAKRPQMAPEVFSTIADTSREALSEMRQMVGLLRSGGAPGEGRVDGSSDGYLPTPGLDDLPELVARTADSVELTEYGARPVVSQALGLTVYRVVQESLTNVLKHGGPSARAAVGVTYAPNGIGIRVVDDGHGSQASSDGKGHGLRGMRERVTLHHGTLTAGPRRGSGFEVLAWLPFPTGGAPTAPPSQTGPQFQTGQQLAPGRQPGPIARTGDQRPPVAWQPQPEQPTFTGSVPTSRPTAVEPTAVIPITDEPTQVIALDTEPTQQIPTDVNTDRMINNSMDSLSTTSDPSIRANAPSTVSGHAGDDSQSSGWSPRP
ncbi:sensor histidine kinase [Microlunatus elymi]|nr:sensor histidine kinase [Microlunatus elymi]